MVRNLRAGRSVAATAAITLSMLLPGVAVWAQDVQEKAPAPPAPNPAAQQGGPRPGGPGQANKPKPYDEVITKEAKTDDGLFKTHRIDDKVYFEIPKSAMGKEILWVTSFSRIQTGYLPFGLEVQDRVVRFEQRGDKVLLRSVDHQMRSSLSGATQKSVEMLSLEPILMTFTVAAYSKDKDPACVIDATPLMTTDITEFSPKRLLGAVRLDSNRTFIENVKSFPNNVELSTLATYVAAPGGGFGFGDGPNKDFGSDSISVVLHHSLVTLPEKPMKPRLWDSRVGFFATGFWEFGSAENRVKQEIYVNRFRLEKKDPAAAVSEPVKPITWYIAAEVPEKWRKYIKAGIEDWNAPFEKAGFKNAIVCKEAPTEQEDPEFDPDDSRYNVIRWLPSTTENAYGPSIVDPRTGEILNASPKFFHNALKLAENWYFVQASAVNPRAQTLPLPEDIVGDTLRYIVCHEIGHCLGFPHNDKASSSFSVKQLRDPAFTSEWGTEASIMDYGRMNYIAQPEDGVTRVIPKLGPYDYFAAEWGYKFIDAPTPEAEKPELDRLASQQKDNPMLRFGSRDPLEDPTRQTEDLSDDPIEAAALGFKNLDRVMGYLIPATTKPGDDYDRLIEVYDEVLNQRMRETMHVVAVVGGAVETNYHYDRGGVANYVPVPAARQKQAVDFLLKNALTTPASLLQPSILSRIEASGASDRVLRMQVSVLSSLMAERRARRMVDQETMAAKGAPLYTLAQLMDDVRGGVWSELATPQAAINPYRRNLQRAYIQLMATKLAGNLSEMRPMARLALMDTKVAIKAALAKTTDRATKAHLVDCNQTIQEILFPKS